MTYTLALKPVAPAWSRPQRLLLNIEGEAVADVEFRPEAEGISPFVALKRLDLAQLLDRTEQLCPYCGHAHALALCQAIEALTELEVPARAAYARLMVVELERAASHLMALAAIFRTLGLAGSAALLGELGRSARQELVSLTGGGMFRPSGLSHDLDEPHQAALREVVATLLKRLFPIANRVIDQRALLARSVEVGVISADAASQFGLGGPLARAAGLGADLRRDAAYAAYGELSPEPATQEGGDVYARTVVLLLETLESLKLIDRATHALPDGPWHGELPRGLPASTAESAVEAPRGPLRYRIEGDGRRLSAVSVQPAPQLDRLLARTILAQARLDDTALIVVSTDPCDRCLAVAGAI